MSTIEYLHHHRLKLHTHEARSGEIVIELSTAGNLCWLTVKDNGVGFEQPLRDGSLGMRLIRSLARQLGATAEIKGDSGTT